MTSLEFCKCKNIDFTLLTNKQIKQLANAISNIKGFVIKRYGTGLGSINIPLLINGTEDFNLNDTNGQEVKFYPISQTPLTITSKENFSTLLNDGEYITIYTRIDDGQFIEKLYKTIPKGTLFGVYNTSAYFQLSKVAFGADLQIGTPFNIEVENNTTENPSLRVDSQYYTEPLDSVTGSTIATQQWQNWDYIYPYWSIDMTNKTEDIKFDLFHKESNQLVGNGYAYIGNNYPNLNYMGQVSNTYSTNNFKIVISNI